MIIIVYARKIEKIDGTVDRQTLKEHIKGVMRRVEIYSRNTHFKNIIKTIALLHDSGKVLKSWQAYFETGKNRIPHSLAGMYIADQLIDEIMEEISAETYVLLSDVIEYVIGAHHGIFDIVSEDGSQNIEKKIENFMKDKDNLIEINSYYDIFPKGKIKKNIYESAVEIDNMFNKMKKLYETQNINIHYYLGVIIRMLLSMQIDGDWSDASSFSYKGKCLHEDLYDKFQWGALIDEFEDYLDINFNSDVAINMLRTQISKECMDSAIRPRGIYRLAVPTGGGKTVSAMRFALHHAKLNSMDRIFYIAPYNSILEQNASTYRKMFGELSDKYILEHHSNVIFDTEDSVEEEELERYKYLTEKWTSPIILTSMVQLLNSFFSDDKKSIRRLHRIKNSVIIIDEFQAVPVKCISIFNLFVNVMSKFFGTTFVLCTATQPPYESILGNKEASKKTAAIDYSKNRDLVNNYESKKEFKRVKILDKTKLQPYNLESLRELFIKESDKTESILMIANTRAIVDKLFTELKKTIELSEFQIIMLSNNMCPNHRLQIITDIRNMLGKQKVILISTPLIEAGVDLSFQKVIRSISGLDSIAQAAGRCNRNKETDLGELILVNIDTKLENISGLEEVKIGQGITNAILNDFKDNPKKYDCDLLSTKAIEIYYKHLHEEISGKTHYPIDDNTTLYDLLGKNNYAKRILDYNKTKTKKKRLLRQAFKTAGEEFKAIEDLSNGVLVPFGKGEEIINKLLSKSTNIMEIRELITEVQHYSVGVYPNVLEKLILENALIFVEEYNFYIVNKNYYDSERGIVLDGDVPESVTI